MGLPAGCRRCHAPRRFTHPSPSCSTQLTMVSRTLGKPGALLASGAYVFLHYALLVAYISKAGEILAGWTDLPLLPAAATFAGQ